MACRNCCFRTHDQRVFVRCISFDSYVIHVRVVLTEGSITLLVEAGLTSQNQARRSYFPFSHDIAVSLVNKQRGGDAVGLRRAFAMSFWR